MINPNRMKKRPNKKEIELTNLVAYRRSVKKRNPPKSTKLYFSVEEAFHKSYIYFLYQGDKVVYIGQTESFMERIAKHFSEATKVFDRFSVEPFEGSYMERLHKEKLLIRKFKPQYNTQHAVVVKLY